MHAVRTQWRRCQPLVDCGNQFLPSRPSEPASCVTFSHKNRHIFLFVTWVTAPGTAAKAEGVNKLDQATHVGHSSPASPGAAAAPPHMQAATGPVKAAASNAREAASGREAAPQSPFPNGSHRQAAPRPEHRPSAGGCTVGAGGPSSTAPVPGAARGGGSLQGPDTVEPGSKAQPDRAWSGGAASPSGAARGSDNLEEVPDCRADVPATPHRSRETGNGGGDAARLGNGKRDSAEEDTAAVAEQRRQGVARGSDSSTTPAAGSKEGALNGLRSAASDPVGTATFPLGLGLPGEGGGGSDAGARTDARWDVGPACTPQVAGSGPRRCVSDPEETAALAGAGTGCVAGLHDSHCIDSEGVGAYAKELEAEVSRSIAARRCLEMLARAAGSSDSHWTSILPVSFVSCFLCFCLIVIYSSTSISHPPFCLIVS